jgi:hypothetical protein
VRGNQDEDDDDNNNDKDDDNYDDNDDDVNNDNKDDSDDNDNDNDNDDEPKKEEKLPPNIKTPKDLLNEPKKINPKQKETVLKVWYIPPAATCRNLCGNEDNVL